MNFPCRNQCDADRASTTDPPLTMNCKLKRHAEYADHSLIGRSDQKWILVSQLFLKKKPLLAISWPFPRRPAERKRYTLGNRNQFEARFQPAVCIFNCCACCCDAVKGFDPVCGDERQVQTSDSGAACEGAKPTLLALLQALWQRPPPGIRPVSRSLNPLS